MEVGAELMRTEVELYDHCEGHARSGGRGAVVVVRARVYVCVHVYVCDYEVLVWCSSMHVCMYMYTCMYSGR